MHVSAASLLTIFGATGDLAQRMLLPSLALSYVSIEFVPELAPGVVPAVASS